MIAVLGPTAAGKSGLAEAIAARSGAEILSVDSMQVYRGMDIGTAKPDLETRRRFTYHLVDVSDPSVEYTVADFQEAGVKILDRAHSDGRPIVIAGGSGLHFRALVDPLEFPPTDPELRSELEETPVDELKDELIKADPGADDAVDLANPRRVLRAVEIMRLTGATPTSRAELDAAKDVRAYRPARAFTAIGVDPGGALRDLIEQRFDGMLADGLLDEVSCLAPSLGRTARRAVGYREILRVVESDADLDVERSEAIRATASLAKRQRTYFRRDPRIRWIPWHHDPEHMIRAAAEVLEGDTPWSS